MSGETDTRTLLACMAPDLLPGEFVFSVDPPAPGRHLDAFAVFATVREPEGLTHVLPKETADGAGMGYDGTFRCITLRIHSSLEAVGLTAAVSTCLAELGVPANVIAGFHHDHVFVPADRAETALAALQQLAAVHGT